MHGRIHKKVRAASKRWQWRMSSFFHHGASSPRSDLAAVVQNPGGGGFKHKAHMEGKDARMAVLKAKLAAAQRDRMQQALE